MDERSAGKFDAAVVLCIHPDNHRLLYVSRRKDPIKLGGIAGGKLDDPSEPFRSAALREFNEETGLTLDFLSEEPVFAGVTNVSGAYVQFFVGRLDKWPEEDEFVGPESLIVRTASAQHLVDGEQCEFFQLYQRMILYLKDHPSPQVPSEFINAALSI